MKRAGLVAIAATLLFVPMAHATLIDHFDTGQQFIMTTDSSSPVPPFVDPSAIGALGGTRTSTLEWISGTDFGNVNKVAFISSASYITFSNDAGMTGRLTESYSFAAQDFLSQGTGFLVTFAEADLNYTATIIVSDGVNTSSQTINETAGLTNENFTYAGFTGSANLSAITSLSLVLESSRSGDYKIESIQTVVPEPVTLALLGLGGGLVLAARRRRMAR